MVTIYSLGALLSQFWTSPLFHIWFHVLLLSCIQNSQEGKVVGYSYLFKNFPQPVVIHTVKGFSIVNEAEVDVFLEFSCFFCDPTDVGNLIFGSSAFSKSRLCIWKLSAHALLKPAWRFLSITLLACEMSATVVVWIFFGLKWKQTFSSTVATAEFSK